MDENKSGNSQGGEDAPGAANQEVIAALKGINDQLKTNLAGTTKTAAEDKELYQLLLDNESSGGENPDLQVEDPDDPKVKKALAAQEKQFEAKLAALEKKAQASSDANMQANVDAQIEREIQQAYDTYGDVLKTNWDKVQAIVDEIPALTVSQALELALAPERSKRLSDIDAKTRMENERKAGAGIGGSGVDVGALTADLNARTHAEAAEKILDRLLAQGGQL